MKYAYEDLSPEQFETLVVLICKVLLGAGVQGFAKGPDGGRDARFVGRRAYIVDCVRQLANGVIEVVEVKKDRRSLQEPDYAAKLDAVRAACQRQGWRFRIIMSAALLEPKWRFDAISDIQSWRLEMPKPATFVVGLNSSDDGIGREAAPPGSATD